MAVRNINDDNTLAYLFKKVENGILSVKESLTAMINGKVSKSGDTMTGDLWISGNGSYLYNIKSTDIDSTANSVPATRWNLYAIRDKNNRIIGWLQSTFGTTGFSQIQIGARRVVSGSDANNTLSLEVQADGTRVVSLSHPNAWMEALGTSSSYLSTTLSQIITPASGITITVANYAQWGRIAQIYLNWKSSNTISVGVDGNVTNVVVGTVVSGKRPKIVSTGTSYGDNGGPAFYLYDTDGKLQLGAVGGTGTARTIAANTAFQCGITYILP